MFSFILRTRIRIWTDMWPKYRDPKHCLYLPNTYFICIHDLWSVSGPVHSFTDPDPSYYIIYVFGYSLKAAIHDWVLLTIFLNEKKMAHYPAYPVHIFIFSFPCSLLIEYLMREKNWLFVSRFFVENWPSMFSFR